jgi:hypothetical protein
MESLRGHHQLYDGTMRIEILGTDDKVINTIDVDPIYAEEAINEWKVKKFKPAQKTFVPQLLFHQRLGYRNTSTLLMADKDDLWADTAIAKDNSRPKKETRIFEPMTGGNPGYGLWCRNSDSVKVSTYLLHAFQRLEESPDSAMSGSSSWYMPMCSIRKSSDAISCDREVILN